MKTLKSIKALFIFEYVRFKKSYIISLIISLVGLIAVYLFAFFFKVENDIDALFYLLAFFLSAAFPLTILFIIMGVEFNNIATPTKGFSDGRFLLGLPVKPNTIMVVPFIGLFVINLILYLLLLAPITKVNLNQGEGVIKLESVFFFFSLFSSAVAMLKNAPPFLISVITYLYCFISVTDLILSVVNKDNVESFFGNFTPSAYFIIGILLYPISYGILILVNRKRDRIR